MTSPITNDNEQDFVRSFQRLVGSVFRLNGQLLATAEGLSADLMGTTAQLRNRPLGGAGFFVRPAWAPSWR